MGRNARFAALIAVLGATAAAMGGTTAAGTISLVSSSGGIYSYDMNLSNTGTTTVGTFWFGWVPGEDFLPTDPTSETAPTGWKIGEVSHSGTGDGWAIQYVANTDLQAGQSLDGFKFSTHDSFSTLQGNSLFYPTTPILTSFVYQNGPFQGTHDQFLVKPVPEPPVMLSLGIGALGLACFRRRRPLAA